MMTGRMRWMLAAAMAAPAMPAMPATAAEPAPCALVDSARKGAELSVPFRTVDGRIYVEARVDGEGPFTFAVDTGASGMGRADAGLVARLGLLVHGTGEASDGVASATVDTVKLASLDIGGFVRRDLEVITRDYASRMAPEARFDGIVGREYFADGLLVIDYPSHRLTFTRGAGLARGMDGVLGYERAFRVPVGIGGVTAEGNLDTGANVAFVLPKPLFERTGGGRRAADQRQRRDRPRDDARSVSYRRRRTRRCRGARVRKISRTAGRRARAAAFRAADRPADAEHRAVPAAGPQSMITSLPSAFSLARFAFICASTSGACGSHVSTSPTMRSGARLR